MPCRHAAGHPFLQDGEQEHLHQFPAWPGGQRTHGGGDALRPYRAEVGIQPGAHTGAAGAVREGALRSRQQTGQVVHGAAHQARAGRLSRDGVQQRLCHLPHDTFHGLLRRIGQGGAERRGVLDHPGPRRRFGHEADRRPEVDRPERGGAQLSRSEIQHGTDGAPGQGVGDRLRPGLLRHTAAHHPGTARSPGGMLQVLAERRSAPGREKAPGRVPGA